MIRTCRNFRQVQIECNLVFSTLSIMKKAQSHKNYMEDKLVASILRLHISQPANYDWKEDYANALKEKYENIH